MKDTGIIRRVDELGRIVLPMELRKSMGIEVKDPINISVEDGNIILRKNNPCCVFCGAEEDAVPFKGKNVCRSCYSKLTASEQFAVDEDMMQTPTSA